MQWRALAIALLCGWLGGCAETVRCPDGQVFDDRGACVPVTEIDAGADGG